MDLLSVIILGIVQGLTEFLPVSSTGHLILAGNLLGTENANSLAFDAVLQLATALAVVVYFRKDVWLLFQTFLRFIGRQAVDAKSLITLKALIIGTIPAVIVGLSLESLMETAFRNPLVVAGVLVVGSLLFAYAEYVYQKRPHTDVRVLTVKTGLLVGLFQCLALIPGMSRSGATLAGGMILGLSRTDATRFAFLLAIPVILGSGSKKLIELMAVEGQISWALVAAGTVTAFIVGLFAIHFMISFVRNHTLWPFIWYRVLLAVVVVVAVTFGGIV